MTQKKLKFSAPLILNYWGAHSEALKGLGEMARLNTPTIPGERSWTIYNMLWSISINMQQETGAKTT